MPPLPVELGRYTGDEELWKHVWSGVENWPNDVYNLEPYTVCTSRGAFGNVFPVERATCNSLGASCNTLAADSAPCTSHSVAGAGMSVEVYGTRRRAVGKQPARHPQQSQNLAVSGDRRRVVGKQPQQQAQLSLKRKVTVRGHYDCLGVRRSATAAEIRAAYRRHALSAHPDKGGDPRTFFLITSAFEELSDKSKRATYDRNLKLFGCGDGLGTLEPLTQNMSAGAPDQPAPGARFWYGRARVAHVKMLLSPCSWTNEFAKMRDEVLQALLDILDSANISHISDSSGQVSASGDLCPLLQTAHRRGSAAGSARLSAKVLDAISNKCIVQKKSGYMVNVTWSSMTVSTAYTRSFTQAIDWQIALASTQGVAQARLAEAGKRSRDLDPLLYEELHQLHEAEPSMQPSFKFTLRLFGKQEKPVQTPTVQNLRLALELRQRFSAVLGKTNAKLHLRREKSRAERDVAQERRDRRKLERQLKAAVMRELLSRGTARALTRGIEDKARPELHKERPTPMKRRRRECSLPDPPTMQTPRSTPPKKRQSDASVVEHAAVQSPRTTPLNPCRPSRQIHSVVAGCGSSKRSSRGARRQSGSSAKVGSTGIGAALDRWAVSGAVYAGG